MSMFGRLLLLAVVLLTLCVPRASVRTDAEQVSVDQNASIELGSALAAEARIALSSAEQTVSPTLPPLLWLGSASWSSERQSILLEPHCTDPAAFCRIRERIGPFNRERGPPSIG
jgi:hypothetical protein